VIVLTAPWDERDARTLAERLEAAVFAPSPDTAQDLIDKYAITAEQAVTAGQTWSGFAAVAVPPTGRRPANGSHSGSRRTQAANTNDLVLWIDRGHPVAAGDPLANFGTGLALNEWLTPIRRLGQRLLTGSAVVALRSSQKTLVALCSALALRATTSSVAADATRTSRMG
jgi:hypothetical protein